MEQSTLYKLNNNNKLDQTSESEKILQKQKYDEIIQLLLSAGYFRARINTLSEFDKVVGGLCWCITSTCEDVDVDILFQENSTIGQKISLSEAIVKALRKDITTIELGENNEIVLIRNEVKYRKPTGGILYNQLL